MSGILDARTRLALTLRERTVLILRDAEQYARAVALAMDLIDVASHVQLAREDGSR